MYLVGKIDIEIYNCITKDITTDEVIITDKQPDYIIEANKPFTALILKEIQIDNKKFKTVVRLATSNDTPSYKNSIITFMKIDDREWNRILKNKKILYKSE